MPARLLATRRPSARTAERSFAHTAQLTLFDFAFKRCADRLGSSRTGTCNATRVRYIALTDVHPKCSWPG